MQYEFLPVGPFPPINFGPFQHLSLLKFEGSDNAVSTKNPLVIVLVEARLIEKNGTTSSDAADLVKRLERFNVDLRKDGYDSRFISIQIKPAGGHRDGESVLSLRQFLQKSYERHPTLAGAIFIGAFPEAMLVRRWLWRKNNATVWINGTKYTNTDYLRIVPEIVSDRCDLVLGDLTGNWQTLYQPGPTQLASILAIPDSNAPAGWPLDGGLFTSTTFQITQPSFTDFFWIRDDDFQIIPGPVGAGSNSLLLRTFRRLRNPEVSPTDAALPNPVARPDIFISRINARNIALSPDPMITGTAGESLLDPYGRPQAIETTTPLGNFWQHDLSLERRLIIDYLDRNHQVRQGMSMLSAGFRTSAIHAVNAPSNATDLSNYLEKASASLKPPVKKDNANIVDFVKWLKEPAVLKGLTTHANCCLTDWGTTNYTTADLESETGGHPWRWRQTASGGGFRYEPSFQHQGANSNFHVYITIWENKALSNQQPAIFIHTGCRVDSPCGAATNPYDAQAYGPKQEAEGFLFYLNATAVIARSKVFNDWPREFPNALSKADAHLGDALKHYYEKDGNDAGHGTFEKAAGNKRCYWWGILGDWTLRLIFPPIRIYKFIPLDTRVFLFDDRVWMLADNHEIVVNKIQDAESAELALAVIRHYGLNERHVIGGEKASWEFYLADGELPLGPYDDEHSIEIKPEAVRIFEKEGCWEIQSGKILVSMVGTEIEASAVLEIICKYQPTHFCWIGDHENPAMTYLRR